ncbi:hypothetical protein P8631_17705, partial [Guyparkeria sp. 1SP6A2]|nr:hypothetical protein [Guyparkeria sp. 1SP6A2]
AENASDLTLESSHVLNFLARASGLGVRAQQAIGEVIERIGFQPFGEHLFNGRCSRLARTLGDTTHRIASARHDTAGELPRTLRGSTGKCA